ncbi:MAG: hypothetical protein K1Y02_07060 [Candidatus Hydrogenedentes bacterium]|nr:hypothetical protein [Candidatus Hydrogenedentota bacterium]
MLTRILGVVALGIGLAVVPALGQGVSVATFVIDATPPMGSPLCGGGVEPASAVDDPLSARGIAILPEGQSPIVLCSVDWVGIGNGGHDAWRQALAEAAGTTIDRVAVHTVHQHDAPSCDFTNSEILAANGLAGKSFNVEFARDTISRAAAALREALKAPRPVNQVGIGQAKVEMVASNRRVLGPDGKVKYIRWTATKDPEARACPEGTIDPMVKLVSLWDGETPVVVLSYYATHPQSHYGKGHVSSDIPGLARAAREQELPGTVLIHFNGAGGNITSGKYNDGAPENRPVLVGRLAEGMKKAWEATVKSPLNAASVKWTTKDVTLPLRKEISEEYETNRLKDPNAKENERLISADVLSWLQTQKAGSKITLSRLTLGTADIMHMPGELFIEYQLAAQDMKKDAFVCMAAYGNYGPGYICTAIAYTQGGYEDGIYASLTAPEVEPVLMDAMRELLQ